MSREFKTSSTQFNMFIGVAIFSAIAAIGAYLLLNIIIIILVVFAVLWTIFAFWGKDRVLITLHDDYLEAKEGIAAPKKLIKYTAITKAEMHKTGKLINLLVIQDGKEKKVNIGINPIEKEERATLFDLINRKIK